MRERQLERGRSGAGELKQAMELVALLGKLDDLLATGKKRPLGSHVRVDKGEAYAIVDQLREADELKQAHWIVENRDEMLAEARHERERILEEAREERARRLAEEEITKGAEERARQLLEDAEARARDIVGGGEDYARDILANIETYLVKLTEGADRGRLRLEDRRRDRAAERGNDQVAKRQAALVA